MRRLLLILLLAMPPYALAEMTFIPLQHRSAEELLPLLRPVVDKGVELTGQDYTLIVNSDRESLHNIRELLQQLDTPLARLQITVVQGEESQQQRLHGGVEGTLGAPQVRLYGTQRQANDTLSQRLQVVEGAWATIRAGEQVPIVTQRTSPGHHGPVTSQSIEYKRAESGFEVKPRVNGEQVTLEVRPFRARRAATGGGIIEQQELITTVSGRLGEWLEIGGVADATNAEDTGTVYATRNRQRTTGNIRLKVERLPQ